MKNPQNGEPGKPTIKATLYRLIRYAFSRLGLIALSVGMVTLSTILGLLPPWLLQYGIDHAIVGKRPELLLNIALIMVLSALIKGAVDFAKRYASEYLAQGVIHDIRSDVYRHLTHLSFSFFDASSTGDLISRITADAESLKQFMGNAFAFIIANLFTLFGVAFVVFRWDTRLGLVYLLFLPFMFHAIRTYGGKVRPAFGKVRRQLGTLTEEVREDLLGIEIIKLFGRESREREQFVAKSEGAIEASIGAARITAFWMPYVHFLLGCMTAAAVWYGGYLVILGEISIGVVAGFLGYTGMLMRPVRQTGMMMGFGSQAVAAGSRIFEILDIESEVQDPPNAYDLPPIAGKVAFCDVSFSYDGHHLALKRVNLAVSPRETIAIVGPTGAGKSTLMHLLPRFYDPDEGRVLIDDHDVSCVKMKSLRHQVGIVLQEPFLFATSIRENISYGRTDASEAAIRQCAKRAQIAEFIERLPLGYDTPVGERGVTLSGGQKQRLALARILLIDPPILILDEPTSSVDAATEEKMQRAMAEVMKDRTTFVIAHRLWTVKNSDRIVVLDEGELVEQGTHEELSASGGVYFKLQDALTMGPVANENEEEKR